MNTAAILPPELQKLVDRQTIEDVLVTYCRGVDRLDRDLIVSCYHPDAIDDHGGFLGGPEAFADYAIALHSAAQTVTQHQLHNFHMEIDGDTAHCETYWTFAGMNRLGAPLSVCGGRYVDRFERRGGLWKIAARVCMTEWHGVPGELFIEREVLRQPGEGHRPSRDRSDPSYERPLLITATRPAFRIKVAVEDRT